MKHLLMNVSLLIGFVFVGRAHAAEIDTILIEVQVGASAAPPGRYTSGFLEGWGRDIVAGEPLVRSVERDLSRSSGPLGGFYSEVSTVMSTIEKKQLARSGDWQKIIDSLEPLQERLKGHVAAIAIDSKTRAAVFDAQLLLLRAYLGLHRESATQNALRLASALANDFPDKPVTTAVRGPAFYEFYKAAVQREEKRRTLTIAVDVRPAECVVYANEHRIGTGPRAQWKATPGQYRLFAECANGRRSRIWDINARKNETAGLDVDFDGAIYTDQGALTLIFPTEAARNSLEVGYASAIGRAVKARRVVLLGVQRDDNSGALSLVGRVIDPNNEVKVAAHQIAFGAGGQPSIAMAQDLGERLRDKELHAPKASIAPPQREQTSFPVSASMEAALVTAPSPRLVVAERRPARIPAWPGWVAAGVGAAGLGVGIAFLAIDGKQSCNVPASAPSGAPCDRLIDTRNQGIAYTTLGAVGIAAGLTWGIVFALRSRHASR